LLCLLPPKRASCLLKVDNDLPRLLLYPPYCTRTCLLATRIESASSTSRAIYFISARAEGICIEQNLGPGSTSLFALSSSTEHCIETVCPRSLVNIQDDIDVRATTYRTYRQTDRPKPRLTPPGSRVVTHSPIVVPPPHLRLVSTGRPSDSLDPIPRHFNKSIL
jgi:hypothetical protein